MFKRVKAYLNRNKNTVKDEMQLIPISGGLVTISDDNIDRLDRPFTQIMVCVTDDEHMLVSCKKKGGSAALCIVRLKGKRKVKDAVAETNSTVAE